MNDISDIRDESAEDDAVRARREFLKKCGKYAIVVPPAMSLLLARAHAQGANDCYNGSVLNPAGKCPPGQQE